MSVKLLTYCLRTLSVVHTSQLMLYVEIDIASTVSAQEEPVAFVIASCLVNSYILSQSYWLLLLKWCAESSVHHTHSSTQRTTVFFVMCRYDFWYLQPWSLCKTYAQLWRTLSLSCVWTKEMQVQLFVWKYPLWMWPLDVLDYVHCRGIFKPFIARQSFLWTFVKKSVNEGA